MTDLRQDIGAVVFDIGNVLIEWHPERFYDRAIGREARLRLFETVDLHAMNDKIDAGALFRETIYETAEAHPDQAAAIRMWHDNWIEMASPRIDRSILLLRALRNKGVPVFALTNFGIHSFAYAQTQYDFLSEFDRAYVSGHMGVIKPDPRIYEMVEAESGLSGAQLIFADDRADNIATAEARGWRGHLFTGAEGWAHRLVDEGLLTMAEAGF